MAASVGDILQITDVQTYLNQTLLNVYFYRVDTFGSAADYQEIADLFQTALLLEIADIQSNSLVHTNTIIKNLTNGLDIFEDPVNIVGEDTFAPGPSFTAASFRLVRSSALTRHGSKRIGGITEGFTEGNNVAAAYGTAIDEVEAAMGSDLVQESAGDLDVVLAPVIVGRFLQDDPNAGELDLSKINDVSSAQFIRTTTQTTRRAGRGV